MASLKIYSKEQTDALLLEKQNQLISGTTIKTINGENVLGPGNISVSSGGVSKVNISTYQDFLDFLDNANYGDLIINNVNTSIGNVALNSTIMIVGYMSNMSLPWTNNNKVIRLSMSGAGSVSDIGNVATVMLQRFDGMWRVWYQSGTTTQLGTSTATFTINSSNQWYGIHF